MRLVAISTLSLAFEEAARLSLDLPSPRFKGESKLPRKVHIKKQDRKHGKNHPSNAAQSSWHRFLKWMKRRR
jgi:hypothetical protein